MNTPHFTLLLLLTACAPAAHLQLARGAAADPGAAPILRPDVASVIDVSDPLDAATCGLPTLPAARCFDADPPAHEHLHGPVGATDGGAP